MTSQDFKPSLLLSMPQMQDPNFARTVVLLCDYGPDGAFGLVVNRPTDMAANEMVRLQPPIARGNDLRLYIGGPVQPERGWILVADQPDDRRVPNHPGGAVPVVVSGAAASGARTAAGAARARHRRIRGVGARDSSTKSSRNRRGSSATWRSISSSTSRRRRCGIPPSGALARTRPRCNPHTAFTSSRSGSGFKVSLRGSGTAFKCKVQGSRLRFHFDAT